MLRPNNVLVRGFDLDGNEIEIEADELMARLFQHEIDHLHGVLMFDRMTPDQRKEAMTGVPPDRGSSRPHAARLR